MYWAAERGHEKLVAFFKSKMNESLLFSKIMATLVNFLRKSTIHPEGDLVNTSAVQSLGWSAILGRYSLEKSYLPILAAALSNPNKGFSEAAKTGDMDLVLYFVSQGANDMNWAMCWAAAEGHMDLVLYLVSQGANDWSERSSNPTSFGRSKAPTLHPLDV